MPRIITAEDLPALLKDGATLGTAGLTLAGFAEGVAMALEAGFLATGHPAQLTLVHASGIGDWKTKGTNHFAHPGMVRRWIGGRSAWTTSRTRACRNS